MLSYNILQALGQWLHRLSIVRCGEKQSHGRAPSLEMQLPLACVYLLPLWPQVQRQWGVPDLPGGSQHALLGSWSWLAFLVQHHVTNGVQAVWKSCAFSGSGENFPLSLLGQLPSSCPRTSSAGTELHRSRSHGSRPESRLPRQLSPCALACHCPFLRLSSVK